MNEHQGIGHREDVRILFKNRPVFCQFPQGSIIVEDIEAPSEGSQHQIIFPFLYGHILHTYGEGDLGLLDLGGVVLGERLHVVVGPALPVARDFLLNSEPDVVVDVVDASNLERNLYFSVQLLEMGVPLVVALNMTDVAREGGIIIDSRALEELIGGRFGEPE